MQYKFECEDVGNLETLDVTCDDARKMLFYALGCHLAR